MNPDAISLDSRDVWISSLTDRAIAHLEAADPQSIRVVGLAGPPTSTASSAGTATAAIGFSGQLVTIADGRAGPPRALIQGQDGRLVLAAREGAVWAATIDGQLFGPDLTNPTATPLRIPGTPVRMAMDRDRAWVLTQDRRQLVAVPLAGGDPVVSALRGVPVDVTAHEGDAWAVTSGDDRLWHATASAGARRRNTAAARTTRRHRGRTRGHLGRGDATRHAPRLRPRDPPAVSLGEPCPPTSRHRHRGRPPPGGRALIGPHRVPSKVVSHQDRIQALRQPLRPSPSPGGCGGERHPARRRTVPRDRGSHWTSKVLRGSASSDRGVAMLVRRRAERSDP